MRAGAATVDITPPPGLTLSGFAARTAPANGTEDPLTVRAVVVDDTALVVCDVLGLDQATSARVRRRCSLPAANVVVAALHTHGAPDAMPGRIGVDCSAAFLAALEEGCVHAIDEAAARRRPCRLRLGTGRAPGIARNRRHPDGTVDDSLPQLRFVDVASGDVVAVVVGYACHPVVLGADNLRYTADYPATVRTRLERALPGSVAVFVTGAAADANTGHSAQDSLSLAHSRSRSFAEARRIGRYLARCALQTRLVESRASDVRTADERVPLARVRREPSPLDALVDAWRERRAGAGPGERALLECWIRWAEDVALPDDAPRDAAGIDCRTSLLRWGDATLVAFPGEVFASTAHETRARLAEPNAIVVGYADDNPGYLPPAEEFAHGGYEIDEAHRYYRQPATFAEDSVARLLASAERLAARARRSDRPSPARGERR